MIKHREQHTVEKIGLPGAHAYRELGVHYHQCGQVWPQGDRVAGTAECLYLKVQAGSRENKLKIAHEFGTSKPATSDTLSPERPKPTQTVSPITDQVFKHLRL